ncbi:MAG: ABC transporter permease [Gemmatimonadetes bacterium]|nr:ABC transporter permease [Gemmatimonadota bacterium]
MNVWSVIRSILGRRGVERDIAEEVEAHLQHRVDDLVASGLSPEEARGQAEVEFGDVERIRRECAAERLQAERSAGLSHALDTWRQDVTYALRQIRRSPGFAAVAILTLALGIGATTTIAAVVHAVVLAPLPFAHPDRLVYVQETTPRGDWFSVAEGNFLDWRDDTSTLADVGALTFRGGTVQAGSEPRRVSVAWTSASLSRTLGVTPMLGRNIQDDEDRPGAPGPVTVLTYHGWQDLFQGDPSVVGRDVILDGTAHTVVGVLPDGLSFLARADLLVPLGASPTSDRGEHYLDVWARLTPGSDIEAARAELSALSREIDATHPEIAGWGVRLTAAVDQLVGPDLQRAGWVLLAAAVLLLLIACVNVSNLLLARSTLRRGEVGVRLALGAGRRRIVRQLLTESLILSGFGGLAGLLITVAALPTVQRLGGDRIPRLDQAAVDPTVLVACLAAVVVAALLFGMVPGLDLGGRNVGSSGPVDALRASQRVDASSGRGLRSAMVVSQIALSMALLLGTGLLVHSFLRLSSADPGFDPEHALTADLSMPDAVYSPDQRRTLVAELLDAVGRVPGVDAVGVTAVKPFSGMNLANFTAREDRMPADARDFLPIAWRVVSPGFFRAMGVKVLEGRTFRDDDGAGEGAWTVIVSKSLARELWPDGDPVGGTLVWGDPQGSRMRVVGVVDDVQDVHAGQEPPPLLYVPHREMPWAAVTLVARVHDSSAAVAAAIRSAVRRTAPGLAVPELSSLREDVRSAVAPRRFNALILGTFAGTGLLLALVGVYGVTAFGVSGRVREIGIRLALGGEPEGILRMVLAHSLRLSILGTLMGAGLAWGTQLWLSRTTDGFLSSMLYHTQTTDLATWVVVPAVLLGAALVAAWIPARRATRVDPREALADQ